MVGYNFFLNEYVTQYCAKYIIEFILFCKRVKIQLYWPTNKNVNVRNTHIHNLYIKFTHIYNIAITKYPINKITRRCQSPTSTSGKSGS